MKWAAIQAVTVIGAFAAVVAPSAQQQMPLFQSNVEVTSIDVGVVDRDGHPITDLSPGDFSVRIDGVSRRVVTAQWMSLVKDAAAPPAEPLPEGFSTNEDKTAGRLIVLAVDDPNIRFGAVTRVLHTAAGFIDTLSASDRVAVVGFGQGSPATPFLSDLQRAKDALSRMTGLRSFDPPGNRAIPLDDAAAIRRHAPGALERVLGRECSQVSGQPGAFSQCAGEVGVEADQMAWLAEQRGRETIRGLSALLSSLRSINAPKTVVLVSQGFVVEDTRAYAAELGAMAAAARTSVYVLELDDDSDIADGRLETPSERQARTMSLHILAAAARGDVIRVMGTGEAAFARVKTELSGYYLLGIESDPRDRDGKSRSVRVDVGRKGSVVRSRQQILDAASLAASRVTSPLQAAALGLASPLPMTALPLKVATFALQGPEQGKLQMLIHADIGADYVGPRVVSVAYAIYDRQGIQVDSRLFSPRLQPTLDGVPGSLLFTGGASLPPGDYTLKFVAAEGDRTGSVEHPMHAGLLETKAVRYTELMVGGPPGVREILQPTVGPAVNFGVVHGYLEAYGSLAEAVTVKYEVAANPAGPPLVSADVPGLLAGDERMIFTLTIPVLQLPPGRYVLRAKVSEVTRPARTLTQSFVIADPPVLMASADAASTIPVADADIYLPVDELLLGKPFSRDDALRPDVLAPFEERVPEATLAAFRAGIAALRGGDYVRAEAGLKAAVQPDVDSVSAIAYLGVVNAALGRDVQSVGAWQTALVGGEDLPQLYDWLSQAMLRIRSLVEARATLEEASSKWPSDPRFMAPLAKVYATFGRGREAVRLLERYLEMRRDDAESLRLGVEWIYQLHSSSTIARTRADDLKLAHVWADLYGTGPQQALVRQWLEFLDRQTK